MDEMCGVDIFGFVGNEIVYVSVHRGAAECVTGCNVEVALDFVHLDIACKIPIQRWNLTFPPQNYTHFSWSTKQVTVSIKDDFFGVEIFVMQTRSIKLK